MSLGRKRQWCHSRVDRRLLRRLEIGLRLRSTLLTSFIRDNRDLSNTSHRLRQLSAIILTESRHFSRGIGSTLVDNRILNSSIRNRRDITSATSYRYRSFVDDPGAVRDPVSTSGRPRWFHWSNVEWCRRRNGFVQVLDAVPCYSFVHTLSRVAK